MHVHIAPWKKIIITIFLSILLVLNILFNHFINKNLKIINILKFAFEEKLCLSEVYVSNGIFYNGS